MQVRFSVFAFVSTLCLLMATAAEKHRHSKRVKRQLAAFTGSNAFSESGSIGPQLVMSCDINEDGYDQEDALVLNLRFAEESGTILQSIKQQQKEIAKQISEISDMFKETRKEQARLFQIQTALKQQNAQMMALLSNTVNSRFGAKSPGFVQNLFDISDRQGGTNDDDHQQEEDKNAVDNPPISPPKRDLFLNDAMTYRDDVKTLINSTATQREVSNDKILARSSFFPAYVKPEMSYMNHTGKSSDLVERNLTQPVHIDADCEKCGDEEFCVSEGNISQCYPCTECASGYSMTSPCTRDNDITCEDINECSVFSQIKTCSESNSLCVNTPGGYLCVGGDASCVDDYFFNRKASQCEPCSSCTSQYIIVPCSKFSDVICRTNDMEQQTDVWQGTLRKINKQLKNVKELHDGFSLLFSGVVGNEQRVIEIPKRRKRVTKNDTDVALVRDIENSLRLRKHGIIWMELNMAIEHSCRSYVQVTCFISDNAEESSSRKTEGAVLDTSTGKVRKTSEKPLAATRIEHSNGDRYKFIDIGAVAEIQPGQNLWVRLQSAHRGCKILPTKSDAYALHSIAPSHKSGPFSVLWLSHDTGAVAYRAITKNNAAYASLYAEFTQEYASDLHVVNLNHNGRYFTFNEAGIMLAKYHQSLYTIGESCTEQGYTMAVNIERQNGESVEILTKAQKSGVSFTDTALSITALTKVNEGDRVSFDLIMPARCQVRYMSDLNLGVVNLLWTPDDISAALVARLDHRENIIGSLKSKTLRFVETQNTDPSKFTLRSLSYIEFKQAGRVYVNYASRIMHSCDYLKAAMNYVGHGTDKPKPIEIFQQVLGDTGGRWDGISFGGSHTVEAGSMCYVTLTCVRGRIDEMSYGEWSTLSILWLPL